MSFTDQHQFYRLLGHVMTVMDSSIVGLDSSIPSTPSTASTFPPTPYRATYEPVETSVTYEVVFQEEHVSHSTQPEVQQIQEAPVKY